MANDQPNDLDNLPSYLNEVFRRQPMGEGEEGFGTGYLYLQPAALMKALAHHHASIQIMNARLNAYDRMERTMMKLVLRTFDPRPNVAAPMTEQVISQVPLGMLAEMALLNVNGFFSLLTYDGKPSERGVLPIERSSGQFFDIVISRIDNEATV